MATTKKATRAVTQIEIRVFKGRQSVCYEFIGKLGAFKFKVDIKVDSYDFQSHAIGYVFDPAALKWNPLYHIPYNAMTSIKTADRFGETKAASFRVDHDHIVGKLADILL